jgi:hypothetical protein
VLFVIRAFALHSTFDILFFACCGFGSRKKALLQNAHVDPNGKYLKEYDDHSKRE